MIETIDMCILPIPYGRITSAVMLAPFLLYVCLQAIMVIRNYSLRHYGTLSNYVSRDKKIKLRI